jgi:hypothetical protein
LAFSMSETATLGSTARKHKVHEHPKCRIR